MGNVVVVGGVNLDLTVHADSRPGDGETVVGSGPVASSGGKGANQAVAAAYAGASVRLCAVVGDDAAGAEQLEQLRSFGVDVSRVRKATATSTGMAFILLTPDGENSIVVGTGANAQLGPGRRRRCGGRGRRRGAGADGARRTSRRGRRRAGPTLLGQARGRTPPPSEGLRTSGSAVAGRPPGRQRARGRSPPPRARDRGDVPPQGLARALREHLGCTFSRRLARRRGRLRHRRRERRAGRFPGRPVRSTPPAPATSWWASSPHGWPRAGDSSRPRRTPARSLLERSPVRAPAATSLALPDGTFVRRRRCGRRRPPGTARSRRPDWVQGPSAP